MAFPEAGGGKVLQGKESIALDIRDARGPGDRPRDRPALRRGAAVLPGRRGGPDRDRRGRAQGGQPRPGVPERARLRHRRAVRRQARLRAVDRRGVRGLADRRPARRRAPGNPRAAAERRAQPAGGRHRAGRPVRRHRRPRRGLRPAARPVRQAARYRPDRPDHDHARQLHPGADRPEHRLPGPAAAEPGRRRVPRPRPAVPAVPRGRRVGVPGRAGRGGVARARGGAERLPRAFPTRASPPRPAARPTPTRSPRRSKPSSRPGPRTTGKRS